MGFEVGIDAIGNVIGVVGEGEPVILLLRSHGYRGRAHATAN
jgi:hypothetical protein